VFGPAGLSTPETLKQHLRGIVNAPSRAIATQIDRAMLVRLRCAFCDVGLSIVVDSHGRTIESDGVAPQITVQWRRAVEIANLAQLGMPALSTIHADFRPINADGIRTLPIFSLLG
jgi:hypothetical protein